MYKLIAHLRVNIECTDLMMNHNEIFSYFERVFYATIKKLFVGRLPSLALVGMGR